MTEPVAAAAWRSALEALDRGDTGELAAVLDRHGTLVTAHACGSEPPYDGYFHRATLLHHVAGNPLRSAHRDGLPGTMVEIAQLLLERGARVDAPCGGGPSQPDTAGGTVLGLVASSARAERDGLAEPLIDCLLAAGAALDPTADGGLLWTALYHIVENRGQREVARYLVEKGHPLDGCYAAGIGSVPELARFLEASGHGRLRPTEDADCFHRHRSCATDGEQVLRDMFLFASVQGNLETARFLWREAFGSGRFSQVLSELRPWGPFPVTPLHGAAWAGFESMVDWLLEIGAATDVRDPTYDGDPAAWARHAGNERIASRLETGWSETARGFAP